MKMKRTLYIIAFIVALAASLPAQAVKTASIVTFSPTSDQGKYVTMHQSQTLQQWGFNAGMYLDYAYQPLEAALTTGARTQGIVDGTLMSHFIAAIGWTDWFTMGFDFPVLWWMSYYNPDSLLDPVPEENPTFRLVDPRLEMKFRIVDIERYHVGLAVVPFMYFPIGDSAHYLGNGMWNGGAKIVFDVDIKNRVFLTLNVGYRYFYGSAKYDDDNDNAVIDDTLPFGGGINVRITDSWAIIGEIWTEPVVKNFFQNQLQSPAEFLGAVRFTPQGRSVKGLTATLGAGRGVTTGIGNPEVRVFAGINYRSPRVVEPPPVAEVEAVVEEKIIITQKIHFEFDRAVIRPISYPILDDVVMLLQKNPQIAVIQVEGHTDWVGPEAYNQRLSEKRARSVRDYLIGKGIEPDRLVAVGYGESQPIADNNTSIGRARNRRVEFTVMEVAPY